MTLTVGLELSLTLAERTLPQGDTSLELMVWVLAGPPLGDVAQITVWERAGKARRERNFELPATAFEQFLIALHQAGYDRPRVDAASPEGDLWTGARLTVTPPGYPTITFTLGSTTGATYTGPDADALRLAFAELLRVCRVGHHQAWWFLAGHPPPA